MASALNDLEPENWEAFHLFTGELQSALINLAPMAGEPVMGLDAAWVRLTLESRRVPVEEWPDMIAKFQILHREREAERKK